MITSIIFDFDGVFTDNFVYSDSTGGEMVRTSRSDSYQLSLFKKFIQDNNLEIDLFILSTESSRVVKKRAEKLGLKVYQGISNKKEFLQNLFNKSGKMNWKGVAYLGNDLNDLECMKLAGYSFCPNDAHPLVKKASKYVFDSVGGDGFVRETLVFIQQHLSVLEVK